MKPSAWGFASPTGPSRSPFHRGCCAPRDLADARAVAAQLDIPFYVMDVRESFKQSVIDDFITEYENGRTPVPCVKCNQVVKFDYLAERAMGVRRGTARHRPLRQAGGGRWTPERREKPG